MSVVPDVRLWVSFWDAQIGNVVHDLFHTIVIALNACHRDTGESTMGYSVAKVDDAIDSVFVFINEVTLQVLLPVEIKAPK